MRFCKTYYWNYEDFHKLFWCTSMHFGGTPLEMFMLKSILSIVVNLYLLILRRKMKFHIQDFSVIWPNPQFPGDLVTLTEEIVNRNVFCAGAYMLLNTNSLNYSLKLPLILLLRKSKHKHSILCILLQPYKILRTAVFFSSACIHFEGEISPSKTERNKKCQHSSIYCIV